MLGKLRWAVAAALAFAPVACGGDDTSSSGMPGGQDAGPDQQTAGSGGAAASGGFGANGGSGGSGGVAASGGLGASGGASGGAAGSAGAFGGAAGNAGGYAGMAGGGGAGGAAPSCHRLETECDGRCVNLNADLEHCGACNSPCAPGAYCVNGQCQGSCPAPMQTCNVDGQPQCVATNTALHCTQCNNRCMPGGVCFFLACACPGGTRQCGGECIDDQADPNNCGGCGVTCRPGLACVAGQCECLSTETRCGSTCVDTQTSMSHCGGCDQTCDFPNASETCDSGTCTFGACEAGAQDCNNNPNDGCERLDSVENCGTCGNDCRLPNTLVACTADQCENLGCETGFDDCDGDPSNGCEPLDTLTNCGSCGNPCSPANATGVCSGGVCQIQSCNPLYKSCDGDLGTGCETSLEDLGNCGDCGLSCDYANASETCAGGSCQMVSCDQGYIDCGSGTGCVLPPVWYLDTDGDGYGVDTDTQTGCNKPSGYASRSGDCDETNPDVNPGASFHTSPLPSGSWDYNCDGQENRQYPNRFSCTVTNRNCTNVDGWSGSVPGCGGSGVFCNSCAWYSINGNEGCECGPDDTRETQGCR